MEGKGIYKKILVDFLIALATLAFLLFALPRMIRFFIPFVIGWIIALVANPVVRFLEKKVKIVRKHSSAIFIVVSIGTVIAVGYFGISILVRQLASLIKDLPSLYIQLQANLTQAQDNMSGLYQIMPDNMQNFLDNLSDNLMGYLGAAISSTGRFSMSDAGLLVKNVAEAFLMAILTIISAYFFIADRERIMKGIREIAPPSIQDSATLIKNNFSRAIGGYFRAQFKIMLIVAVILFVGFEILGINYSFLLALGVAFLDFLPVFGTGTVLFPWTVIDLFNGQYFEGICLVVLYLICQVVRQILQPKMVGDSVGLSPLAALFFMFIGYRLKGVLGMIIGIPVGMAAINLYQAGLFDKLIRGMRILIHDLNEYRKY